MVRQIQKSRHTSTKPKENPRDLNDKNKINKTTEEPRDKPPQLISLRMKEKVKRSESSKHLKQYHERAATHIFQLSTNGMDKPLPPLYIPYTTITRCSSV